MIRKELWGPHLWYSIHFIALGFPNDASSIDKKNYKNFYISLPNVIPCEECSKHLINSLNQFPIDNFLLNKDKLFEWTVIIHNEVNKLLNKEIWSVDRAKLFYNNFNINKTTTCKTTNNINNLYIILIIILIIIIGVLLRQNKIL